MQDIESKLLLQQDRNMSLNFIMQKMKELYAEDASALERLYEYDLEKKEESIQDAKEAIFDYKKNLMDPGREVAKYERKKKPSVKK